MIDVNYVKMLGETAVLHDLTKRQYIVYKSINDTNGVDFIVDTGKLLKVQVKAISTPNKYGAYAVKLIKIRTNRTQNRVVPYKKGEIDIMAIYLVDINKICYFKFDDICNIQEISLRESSSKFANVKRPSRLISEYKDFPKYD